jgi:ribonucleotide monophosphatase NagD (HAD superfamily)
MNYQKQNAKTPAMTHTLSPLPHTWIFDLDGTIVKHNGYKDGGGDVFLEGAEAFLKSIPKQDMIIFITSRTDAEKELTENFLKEHDVQYDAIIYNAPYGERILINDEKPSGLKTAIAINTGRDVFMRGQFVIDESL